MTDPTLRALIGAPGRPELVLRREYRVAAADLRDACTSPDRLARWLGTVEGDPAAVGDAFTLRLDGDRVVRGRVLVCDGSGLRVSWAAEGEPPSVLEVRWRPVGGERAELLVRHGIAESAEPPEADALADAGGGWEAALRALAASLAAPDADAAPAAPDGPTAAWGRMAARPLEVEQLVEADPARVWEALASADGLRTWWWRHWRDVTIEADVRVGGDYRIEAPSAGIRLDGTYLVVDAPDRLAFTWRWTDADGSSADEAVDIRLTGDGDRTRVTVRHTGPWADDAAAASYRQGWEFTLGELAAVVARPR